MAVNGQTTTEIDLECGQSDSKYAEGVYVMANGRTHTKTNLAAAGVLGIASIINPVFFPISLGTLTSVMVGPDIDVDDGNISNYFARKLGFDILWRFITYPYRVAFKHRGISHWPVIGTLTRVLYFIVPLFVILFASDQNGKLIKSILVAIILQFLFIFLWFLAWPLLQMVSTEAAFLFLLGLVFGDALHLLLDMDIW